MTIRIGLVGCGAIARQAHLPALRALADGAGPVSVVAFTSRTTGAAQAARDWWGSGAVVETWAELVVRDDVDAVVVATPNALHAPVAIAAALAGKHVLVEKPIARTVREADQMIAAASAAGVVLMPAHNVRLQAPFLAVADAVAGGLVGAVTSVRAVLAHAGPEHWAPGAAWFRDPDLAGGGALLDLGSHVADLLRAVTGDEVTEVSALLSPIDGVDSSAHVLLRFAHGATGSFHASWTGAPGPDFQLTVQGSKGRLYVDPTTPLTFHGVYGSSTVLPLPASRGVCDAFLAAIRAHRAAPAAAGGRVAATGADRRVATAADGRAATAADGRAALAVVEAAYESARTQSVHRLLA